MSILMRMLPLILTEKYNNPVDKKLRLYVTEDSLLSSFRMSVTEFRGALTSGGRITASCETRLTCLK